MKVTYLFLRILSFSKPSWNTCHAIVVIFQHLSIGIFHDFPGWLSVSHSAAKERYSTLPAIEILSPDFVILMSAINFSSCLFSQSASYSDLVVIRIQTATFIKTTNPILIQYL